MDDLTTNWNHLTLSNKEGPSCYLNDEVSSQEFIIAIKLLTKRALNIDALAKTFTPLWRSINRFKVHNLGSHELLFVVNNEVEVEKVLQILLWSFDKHLMIMERHDKNFNIEKLKFDKLTFWVQVHGLLIKFMNVKATEKICAILGKVIPTVNLNEVEGRNFIRVRVSMDINVPLCRG